MFVYRDELSQIAKNSLVNCHVFGMESVMFDNTPGKRVRAFICRADHEMWRNIDSEPAPLSIAIHSHHCDIELSRIFGESYNVIPVLNPEGKLYHAFSYESAITGGGCKFVKGEANQRHYVLQYFGLAKKPWFMAASELHTWYVPAGHTAAWLVREFREDPLYTGITWSDADLENFDASPLYKPMSVEYLKELLDKMQVSIHG
jgi:hypothetical protein